MLRIKEILQGKGITSKDLAEKLSITENALSLIVNGKRQPRFELLLKIAKELDVDVRELFQPTKETTQEQVYIKRDGKYFPVGEMDIDKIQSIY